jgi:hypothetical protein
MAETPRQMCQRHVTEGTARLERQRRLIQRLEDDGREAILPAARDLLERMLEFQRDAETHLAAEQEKEARR